MGRASRSTRRTAPASSTCSARAAAARCRCSSAATTVLVVPAVRVVHSPLHVHLLLRRPLLGVVGLLVSQTVARTLSTGDHCFVSVAAIATAAHRRASSAARARSCRLPRSRLREILRRRRADVRDHRQALHLLLGERFLEPRALLRLGDLRPELERAGDRGVAVLLLGLRMRDQRLRELPRASDTRLRLLDRRSPCAIR